MAKKKAKAKVKTSAKTKVKVKAFPWDKAGTKEFKKFADYITHCRDFAESIAKQKNHSAVIEEDVADAIQKYAALWAGQCSKSQPPASPSPPTDDVTTKPAKAPRERKPAPPPIDAETQMRIDELKKFITEEEEAGEIGFGDPKARIAHWRREIDELMHGKPISNNPT